MIQSSKMKLIAVDIPLDGFTKVYEQMEGR
jgi:hypothetical protein